jgi:hypothetical protein
MDTDQRKSFRILVPDGQEKAVLKVGRRCVTVRIVDSSAGGFALASRETLKVKRGDTLRLRTIAGWHEVRVVRHELFTDGILIGVERLGDIDDSRVQSSWLDWLFLPSGQAGVGGTTAARIFTVGALAGVVLAGFVWLAVQHDRRSSADEKILPQAANQMVDDFTSQAQKVADSMRGDSPANPTPPARAPETPH